MVVGKEECQCYREERSNPCRLLKPAGMLGLLPVVEDTSDRLYLYRSTRLMHDPSQIILGGGVFGLGGGACSKCRVGSRDE
jgi:hypothetical protein